jgi:hypothetical protein
MFIGDLTMSTWSSTSTSITTLGEINYSVASSMYVYAYPTTDSTTAVTDTSYAAYNKIVSLTDAEKSLITDTNYYIIEPNNSVNINSTSVDLNINEDGTVISTGMSISSNGQITGKLTMQNSLTNLILKVQLTDPPLYTAYTEYRSYSYVQFNGKIYKVKSTTSTPFSPEDSYPNTSYWEYVSSYQPQYTSLSVYALNNTYNINDIVKSNGTTYQLGTACTTSFRTSTSAPDTAYWYQITSSYNSEAFTPSLTYSINTTYSSGVYVQLGTSVYHLIADAPYTSATSFLILTDWEYVREVQTVKAYTQNTIYNVNDLVLYNSVVYQLVYTLPFIANTVSVDTAFWVPITYTETNSVCTKLFRIYCNTRKSSLIGFNTASDLGSLTIGNTLGNTESIMFELNTTFGYFELYSGSATFKTFDNSGIYACLPQGLRISSSGDICGTPYGPAGTYTFDVIGRDTTGSEKQQTFTLRLTNATSSTCKAQFKLSYDYEREWYSTIASDAFTNVQYYREFDENFGLQSVPKIHLKNNLLMKYNDINLSITQMKTISKSILGTHNISFRVGNFKYITALDSSGNKLYELLYKEVLPVGHKLQYSTASTSLPTVFETDFSTIKEKLTYIFGSNDDVIQDDILRNYYITDTNVYTINEIDSTLPMYYDDIELWQSNSTISSSALPYFAIIPVAYTAIGESQKIINKLINYGTITESFYDVRLTATELEFKLRNN